MPLIFEDVSPEPKTESEFTLIANFVGSSSVLQPSGVAPKSTVASSFLALRVPDSRIIQQIGSGEGAAGWSRILFDFWELAGPLGI